jgi:hypothetical protein
VAGHGELSDLGLLLALWWLRVPLFVLSVRGACLGFGLKVVVLYCTADDSQ